MQTKYLYLLSVVGLVLCLGLVVYQSAPAIAANPPAQATATPATDPIQPESCATCHKEAGAKHQASYNELYQDGVIQVTDLAYSFAPTGTHTVIFKMTKDGVPFDASKADNLAIYFTPYADGKFQFEPAAERLSLVGNLTYDGEGGNTSTLVADIPDVSSIPGLIVLYGRDETIGTIPDTRVAQARYPFAAMLETGSGVDYVSAANVAGCEKCHSVPYLKHGYIYGQVNQDPGTDFYTCKACHLDNGEGGHFEWQLLVDDPAAAAEFLAAGEDAQLPPEQAEKYAYKTSVMNDVHMSHAMEFPYPQSMANCVTCHEGKLDTVLADENFTGETCKSCHPVTGSEEYGTAERALLTIMPEDHSDMDLNTETCSDCHSADGGAPTFSEIHPGYDKAIYTADGLRYSDAISVTIDSASFDGSTLNFQFSAADTQNTGLDVTTITPTVLVSLYGYDTKDYVIGAHERLIDDNGDGTIDNNDQRALEYVVGEEHPRMSTVSAGDGSWEVSADLSTWTDLIADGTVKRVEIGVMPALVNADGVMLALNAPSRTFDLGSNVFADDFYSPIAKVVDGCNNCHDALATTFHEPDHGGNIVVCRMCHITKSGASHLEVQSRSLDSYVHSIHSFQEFDIGDVDFTDPVQALHYEEYISFPFPTHANTNCESCHVEGKYNVPDQSKSLPGILSATDVVTTTERSISDVPSYVTGPASRACGGCHRAAMINEDKENDFISFMEHTKQGGYLIEAGDDPSATLKAVTEQIEALFK
jgi:OmcA/MtrC family decaheme c-type cytochrome